MRDTDIFLDEEQLAGHYCDCGGSKLLELNKCPLCGAWWCDDQSEYLDWS